MASALFTPFDIDMDVNMVPSTSNDLDLDWDLAISNKLDLRQSWLDFDSKQQRSDFIISGVANGSIAETGDLCFDNIQVGAPYTLAGLDVDARVTQANTQGVVSRKRRREAEENAAALRTAQEEKERELFQPKAKKAKKRGRKPKGYRKPSPKPLVYSKEERAAAVARYRAKRKLRDWTKKTLYAVRKRFAAGRSRVGGRFIKKVQDPLLQARDRRIAEENRKAEEQKAEEARHAAEAAARQDLAALERKAQLAELVAQPAPVMSSAVSFFAKGNTDDWMTEHMRLSEQDLQLPQVTVSDDEYTASGAGSVSMDTEDETMFNAIAPASPYASPYNSPFASDDDDSLFNGC